MNTIYGHTALGPFIPPRHHVSAFVKRCWNAFQERRKRERVRATLYRLSNRELHDMGISSGDIEYVALHRSIDPRGQAPEK